MARLTQFGLAGSVVRYLEALGPNPSCRHFPTQRGIETAAWAEHSTEHLLSEYPVSREWFRLPITLSEGRSSGIVRQGPMLSSGILRDEHGVGDVDGDESLEVPLTLQTKCHSRSFFPAPTAGRSTGWCRSWPAAPHRCRRGRGRSPQEPSPQPESVLNGLRTCG